MLNAKKSLPALTLTVGLSSGTLLTGVPHAAAEGKNTTQSCSASASTLDAKVRCLLDQLNEILPGFTDTKADEAESTPEELYTKGEYAEAAVSAVSYFAERLTISDSDKETFKTAISNSRSDIDTLVQNAEYAMTYYSFSQELSAASQTKNEPSYKFAQDLEKRNFDDAFTQANQLTWSADQLITSLPLLSTSITKLQEATSNLSGRSVLNRVVSQLSSLNYLSENQLDKLYSYGAESDDLNEFAQTVTKAAAIQAKIYMHTLDSGRVIMHDSVLYKNATDEQRKAYDDAVAAGQEILDTASPTEIDKIQDAFNSIDSTFNDMAQEKENPDEWRQIALISLASAIGGTLVAFGAHSYFNQQESVAEIPEPEYSPTTVPVISPPPGNGPAVLANTGSESLFFLLSAIFTSIGTLCILLPRYRKQ